MGSWHARHDDSRLAYRSHHRDRVRGLGSQVSEIRGQRTGHALIPGLRSRGAFRRGRSGHPTSWSILVGNASIRRRIGDGRATEAEAEDSGGLRGDRPGRGAAPRDRRGHPAGRPTGPPDLCRVGRRDPGAGGARGPVGDRGDQRPAHPPPGPLLPGRRLPLPPRPRHAQPHARTRAGAHGDPDAGHRADQGPRPARRVGSRSPAGTRARAAGSVPVRHAPAAWLAVAGEEDGGRTPEDPPGPQAARPRAQPPPGVGAPARRRRLRRHGPVVAAAEDPDRGAPRRRA